MFFDVSKVLLYALCILPATSWAKDGSADLARQLANPVAALSSVPFELNYDQDIGATDQGKRWTLNIQSVVPGTSQSGTGDIVQSLFSSPKVPSASGWIWGIGPTVVALRQDKGWTYSALVNHIWSDAGMSERGDVSNTYL